MFNQLKNIDTAFRHIKRFSIVFMIACTLITLFVVWKYNEMVARERQRIYILYNGKALEATAADQRDNIPVELRDHIGNFHRFFFTLDPDEKVIQENINSAFNLADESAKKVYDNLREQGFYANIISANTSQRIKIDSIALDIKVQPYSFRCYATQQLIRATSTQLRQLITAGQIRPVSKSDNNPHGFLIQRWKILNNEDRNKQ